MKKMSSKKGFFFGGIVGVLLGMLIAPKAGSETRAQLRQSSEGWRELAEELASKAQKFIHEVSQGPDLTDYQDDGYSHDGDDVIPFDQGEHSRDKDC